MSESKTAAIRKFKSAFAKHSKAWRLFADPAAAMVLLEQAVKLLQARISSGTDTIGFVNSEPTAKTRKMTTALSTESQDILRRSDDAIKTASDLPKTATQPDIDKATSAAQGLIDEWDVFERRCASARNMMKTFTDDDALAAELARRAKTLLRQASELAAIPLKEATRLVDTLTEISLMFAEKKNKMDDFLKTTSELDECQEELIALSLKAPKSDDLSQKALQNVYGITVELGAGTKGYKVPYQKLLAAFSMVPPEHAKNLALSKFEIKEVKFEGEQFKGGLYAKTDKKITITPDVLADELEQYTNPETGELEAVNSFSVTTLHEIGHSVDEAYGLMSANAKSAGWTEIDALGYVSSDFDINKDALASALRTFLATCIPSADKIKFDDGELKKGYLSYAAGTPVDDSFKDYLTKLIRGSGILEAVATVMVVRNALGNKAVGLCADAKRGGKVSDLWAELEKEADRQLDDLSKVTLVSLKTDEIRVQFLKIFEDKETVETDKADATDFRIWLSSHEQFDSEKANRRVETATKAAATWSNTVGTKLPQPVDLKKFGSRQKPWNKLDLTTEPKIGILPASHQPYEGETKWWRYSDRKTSFVTDYQWRSPGEWFAELYAITWFKKVEPPKVPGPLRAYLYGGSVAA